jgi:hypothetical protein
MAKFLQSSLKTIDIDWSAAKNHIPCMAHVIQLALDAFMDALGVKGRQKCWEEQERERLTEGGTKKGRRGIARVDRIIRMKSGFGKIMEKVY